MGIKLMFYRMSTFELEVCFESTWCWNWFYRMEHFNQTMYGIDLGWLGLRLSVFKRKDYECNDCCECDKCD